MRIFEVLAPSFLVAWKRRGLRKNKTMPPKVSVIIPVHNTEKYLPHCLRSVLGQTMKEIEIIAVNDGSWDQSGKILDDYAAKDSRLTVIHSIESGISASRNNALRKANGEFILFLDSDDWIEPPLCEQAVEVANREWADVAFFLHQGRGRKIDRLIRKHPFSEWEPYMLVDYPQVWSKLWRTIFLKSNRLLFGEEIQRGADIPFHWNALLHRPTLTLLPQRYYHRRFTTKPITAKDGGVLFHEDIFLIYHQIADMLRRTANDIGNWQQTFLQQKLTAFYTAYLAVKGTNRPRFLERIETELGRDEWAFLDENPQLPFSVKCFYRAINGTKFDRFKNTLCTGLHFALHTPMNR
jgi:glycosyltransferase EpsH